eukprot:scaffold55253_cov61-Phaeocystis_antarctica.AAC.2
MSSSVFGHRRFLHTYYTRYMFFYPHLDSPRSFRPQVSLSVYTRAHISRHQEEYEGTPGHRPAGTGCGAQSASLVAFPWRIRRHV